MDYSVMLQSIQLTYFGLTRLILNQINISPKTLLSGDNFSNLSDRRSVTPPFI